VWTTHRSDGDTARLVAAVLENTSLWGRDLRQIPGLDAATTRNLQILLAAGPQAAIRCLS
jgi:mannitol-1-phosphate/altronate dehydrogenase